MRAKEEVIELYVTRDEEHNTMYVGFRDRPKRGEAVETREVLPAVYVDLDAAGRLLGLEIVNTERALGVPASAVELPQGLRRET